MAVSSSELLHVGGDGAEIAALRRRVDLHHAAGCCIATRRRWRASRLDVGDAAEHLRRAPCLAAVIGRVCSALRRVDLVLRRLHHDRVGDAVVGIEPIGRRTPGRCRRALTTMLLVTSRSVSADVLRAGAVDIDIEARAIRATAGCARRRCRGCAGSGAAAGWHTRSSPPGSAPRTCSRSARARRNSGSG